MTGADHHRDDLDDRVWARLEPRLPGRAGEWRGVAGDNRRFVNAVLWILRTGSSWRDLPPDFGGWKNTHRRFCRWRDKGVWEQLLEVLIDEPGFEWLMVGMGPAGHRDGGGATSDVEGLAKDAPVARRLPVPRYAWPWLRLVCRSDSLSRLLPPRVMGLRSGWAWPLRPSEDGTAATPFAALASRRTTAQSERSTHNVITK